MTHIQQQRALFDRNRASVIKILNWSEERYWDYLFDQAEAYLKYQLDAPNDFKAALKKIPLFWAFWINQWNLRDEQVFLPKYRQNVYTTPEQFYRQIHSHERVQHLPQKGVLEEAYGEWVGDSMDDIKKIINNG